MNKELVCMLIDDDTEDHEIFLMALQNIEPLVKCIVENDPHLALHRLRNVSVKPDFIFIDMNMPRMTGKELLIEIKKMEHLKEAQLVAYSSSSFEKEMMIALGATQFVPKPANIPMLEKALNSCFSPAAA